MPDTVFVPDELDVVSASVLELRDVVVRDATVDVELVLNPTVEALLSDVVVRLATVEVDEQDALDWDVLVVVADATVDDEDVDDVDPRTDELLRLVVVRDTSVDDELDRDVVDRDVLVVVSLATVDEDDDEELDCWDGGRSVISVADSPRRNTSLWMVSRPCQSVT